MKKIDVLAVCPFEWSGVRKSISQGADAYADVRDARAAIRDHDPAEVRFGGYSSEWRPILEFARRRKCRIVVTIHHTPAFHEFTGSSRAAIVKAIEDFKKGLIDGFETPHEGVAGTLTLLGIPCGVRSNTTEAPADVKDRSPRPGLHIGIFGTGLPWKNMDTQMLAAALTVRGQPGGMIHVQHAGDTSLMNALGVQYQVHPQMAQDQFYRLVASMTVNMAVTFTETFGYLAVESFLLGVPCLFSPMTPAFHDVSRESPLWSCRVDRIDDPMYISARMREVMEHREEISEAGKAFCQRHCRSGGTRRSIPALP
jgi:hypothetical protein